jgi:hypothetical protein
MRTTWGTFVYEGAILAEPGWKPDPNGRREWRYFDGVAWTDKVSDAGAAGTDPYDPEVVPPPPPASPAEDRQASRPRRVSHRLHLIDRKGRELHSAPYQRPDPATHFAEQNRQLHMKRTAGSVPLAGALSSRVASSLLTQLRTPAETDRTVRLSVRSPRHASSHRASVFAPAIPQPRQGQLRRTSSPLRAGCYRRCCLVPGVGRRSIPPSYGQEHTLTVNSRARIVASWICHKPMMGIDTMASYGHSQDGSSDANVLAGGS